MALPLPTNRFTWYFIFATVPMCFWLAEDWTTMLGPSPPCFYPDTFDLDEELKAIEKAAERARQSRIITWSFISAVIITYMYIFFALFTEALEDGTVTYLSPEVQAKVKTILQALGMVEPDINPEEPGYNEADEDSSVERSDGES